MSRRVLKRSDIVERYPYPVVPPRELDRVVDLIEELEDSLGPGCTLVRMDGEIWTVAREGNWIFFDRCLRFITEADQVAAALRAV